MRPYVVSQVVDNDGNIVKENSPQVVRSVVSKETSDFVRTAIEDVFTEGTGKKAAIQGTLLVVKLVQQQVKVVLQHMDGLLDILNLIIMNIL